MYESPIMLYQRKIADGVQLQLEDNIMKAVLAYDIKVDKNELIRALRYDREQYDKGYEDGKSDAVKHGRWINKTKNIKGLCDYRFDCSACEHIFWSAGIESFNYCPNCGAKMDLEG